MIATLASWRPRVQIPPRPLLIPSFAGLSPFGKELHREPHSNVSNQHSCTDLLTFQSFINSIITLSKLLSFPSEAISCPLIFLSSVCVSSVIEIVVIAATIDIESINTIYVLLTHGDHTHYRENTRKNWTIPRALFKRCFHVKKGRFRARYFASDTSK
jgi:hypothetical protein